MFEVETGGISFAGVNVDTSRESQSLITGAWATAQADPETTFKWKAADGSWSDLTAPQVTALN